MRSDRALASILLIALLLAGVCHAEEPDEMREKGIAALKESQTNPRTIVDAARAFVKASELYSAAGNDEKATEMNSFLYWCKKKMTMADIDAFVAGGEVAVSTKLKAVETLAPTVDEAQKYLDRAEQFANSNPAEHLLIAIRFYEVADRFKGSEVSMKAMDRSLKEQLQSTTAKPSTPVVASPKPAPITGGNQPLPNAEKIKDADKLVKDLFKAEYAKTDAPSRLALAAKLLEQADDNKGDVAAEYVLLRDARDIAVAAGNVELTTSTHKRLRGAFTFDFVALLADLTRVQATVKTEPPAVALASLFAATADDALDADNFEQALRFILHVDDMLPLIKDADLKTRLKAKIASIQALKRDSVPAIAALKTLATKPDDSEANLIAGKFALSRGKFEAAFPLLAKSKDAALSELGKRELTAATDATEQVKLADGWFNRAEKETNTLLKARMQERAALLYRNVLPALSGLAKLTVETRMKTLVGAPKIESATAVFGDLTRKLNKLDNWETRNGTWTQTEKGILGEGDSDTAFKDKLPTEFVLEFTMIVKKGMRPRVYFDPEFYFGNEGDERALYIYHLNVLKGAHFKYNIDQELFVRVIASKTNIEFVINETRVAMCERAIPGKISLRLKGGDYYSKGAVIFGNFKLRPVK